MVFPTAARLHAYTHAHNSTDAYMLHVAAC
jgi:hypothetical protein